MTLDFLRFSFLFAVLVATLVFPGLGAHADSPRTIPISIRHHVFVPEDVTVLKGQPFTIHVTNEDAHPEEFESYDLEFEIIILPHRSIDVPVRPLPPGTYEFFGDFHPRTARGHIHVLP
jgi:hypothetical protein